MLVVTNKIIGNKVDIWIFFIINRVNSGTFHSIFVVSSA
jgi:hypothetical protein